MIYDFHTHTTLSDGELLPMELIRRAIHNGYTAIAIADHASPSTMERFLREISKDCELVAQEWGFTAIPAVELTHVPPSAIAPLARRAKELGAKIVVVHGETVVEPVPPGTNRAAVECEDVDILAHPGLVTPEEVKIAAERGIYLEITCRKGHSLTNGHVAKLAMEHGARMVVNTDTHSPGDLLTEEFARIVALGAGIPESGLETVLVQNPLRLLSKIGVSIGQAK